jgi:hypothetical protein
MDTAKNVVVAPPKSTVPPVKTQPEVVHKAQPKVAGSCCGSGSTSKA